ncbi:hypothetical protein [Bosea sp. (in: a-proteobacteria)]|uniref:hypothetical protein n=1 Tax=Bosea sp. (in: a-proteobacteria) TaxID=1871050 RepID=UPI0025BBAC4B|nr:hypothetical protein [Bosea sp. (in: a-proteobacteria)]MBR3194697.1 hypothetical protein [Bosea sp. (in: a-proteobacteria)]
MPKPNVPVPFASTVCGDATIDRLLRPSCFYRKPRDVLDDRSLTPGEKRAILSSWASDACAVTSCPQLRHPDFAAEPVSFDDVMDALVALDRGDGPDRDVVRRSRGSETLSA